jgi:Cd2+/Zn2+-exporting ATPase
MTPRTATPATEEPRSTADLLPAVPLLALDRQYAVLREQIRAALDRVCDSGRFVLGPDVVELEAELAIHEKQGRTVTLLADDSCVLALFAVADTIRETSKQAIVDLKALGVTSVMLTGDNTATAKAIAAQAGIDDARGDLLPEAKLDAIKEMQKRYGATGMTGDGINDAPALAQADIGFAMGGAGTDTAMEAADVVIMNDNLQRVAETVRLSKRTHAVLWQNITLALGIKSVFLVMAVVGTATMWMAVFADMGASLLVVGNGLRLLRGTLDPASKLNRSEPKEHAHSH